LQGLVRGAALLGRGQGEEDGSGGKKKKGKLFGRGQKDASGEHEEEHEEDDEDDETTTDSESEDTDEQDVNQPTLSPEDADRIFQWPPFSDENSSTTSRKPSNANTIRGAGNSSDSDALPGASKEEPVVTPSEIIGGQEAPLTNLQVQAIFTRAEEEEKEEEEGGGADSPAASAGMATQASEAQSSTRRRHKRDALKQEWYRLTRAHAKYIPHLQKSQHHDKKSGEHGKDAASTDGQATGEDHQAGDVDEEASHSLNQSLSFLEEDSQLAAHLDQQAFDELEQEQESNPIWSKLLRRKPAKRTTGSASAAALGAKGTKISVPVPSKAAAQAPSASEEKTPAQAQAQSEQPQQVTRLTSDATVATRASVMSTTSEESAAEAEAEEEEANISPVNATAEEELGKLSLDDTETTSTAVGSSDEALAGKHGDSMDDAVVHKGHHLRRENEPSEQSSFLVLPSIDPAKKLEALREEFGELKCGGELLKELGEERYVSQTLNLTSIARAHFDPLLFCSWPTYQLFS
jgi:hypothetical protein